MIKSAVIVAIASPHHHSQFVRSRPHAMLPALGKPMVVRAMNRLHEQGITHFIVIVGVNEGSVAAYLNRQWLPDVQLEFVLKSPNDTLHKILANIARKIEEPFILLNYNSFTQPQALDRLLDYHQETPDSLILTVAQSTLSHNSRTPYALTHDKFVTAIQQHPSENGQEAYRLSYLAVCGNDFVNYMIAQSSLRNTGKFILTTRDVLDDFLQKSGHPVSYCETSWTLEIETDSDLLMLNKRLLDDGRDAHILSEIPHTVKIISPVRIDPRVSIGQNAIIGPYVYLEQGVNVGHQAEVAHSLIIDHASISPKSQIQNMIVSPSTQLKITQ